jgi:ABC-type amino acid transport substrate-binding protein
MVLLGRVDFYVDDRHFIQDSIDKNEIDYRPEDFAVQPVGRRAYRPVFSDSPRGRVIMDLYDRGMETLHRSGELQRIFAKWGFPVPAYDFAPRGGEE